MIAAIVAIARNNVIGKNNDLPWYLPADLKHFKKITTGHTVVMGRTTYESIARRLGHSLPNRRNIVISKDKAYRADGCEVVHSIEKARSLFIVDNVYIIGGAQTYEQFFPYIDRLYVTEIDVDINGDTYFPAIDKSEWKETSREHHEKDDKNLYNYDFIVYERKAKF
jgi:dihydrofolate reductase